MGNITIRITNGTKFVLTSRNQDNSTFYIKPKADFERELVLLEKNSHDFIFSTNEGTKPESDIVNMIQSGIEFYTYNMELKTFTKVIEVSGHIKTVANETESDNISKLPIY
jgi:hypothetical protein